MAEKKKQTVEGMTLNDTKRTRKYSTMWGVIYIPLNVVAELGNPDRVTFTIEAQDGEG